MRFQPCCMMFLLLAAGSMLYAQNSGSHRVFVRVVGSNENKTDPESIESVPSNILKQNLKMPTTFHLLHAPKSQKISISTRERRGENREAIDVESIYPIWNDSMREQYSRLIKEIGLIENNRNLIDSTNQQENNQKEKTITYTVTEKN